MYLKSTTYKSLIIYIPYVIPFEYFHSAIIVISMRR